MILSAKINNFKYAHVARILQGDFMNNSKIFMGIISVLIILIVACTPSQPPPPEPEQRADKVMESAASGNVVNVAIRGFKFAPQDVTVKVGDTVIWANEDAAPHTVESSDNVLKSDTLSKGDTYKYTFTKAGKHDYICAIHPSMHGSVTVQ